MIARSRQFPILLSSLLACLALGIGGCEEVPVHSSLYLAISSQIAVDRLELRVRIDEGETFVGLDPENAAIHFDLGTCHHRDGRLGDAIAGYTAAIERDASHIEAHNNRAIAHLLCRDVAAAQADWQACLAIDRRRGTIRRNLKAVLTRFRSSR